MAKLAKGEGILRYFLSSTHHHAVGMFNFPYHRYQYEFVRVLSPKGFSGDLTKSP
jgi:hypothetical protein